MVCFDSGRMVAVVVVVGMIIEDAKYCILVVFVVLELDVA